MSEKSDLGARVYCVRHHGKLIDRLTLADLRHILRTHQVDASCPAKWEGDDSWTTVGKLLSASRSAVDLGHSSAQADYKPRSSNEKSSANEMSAKPRSEPKDLVLSADSKASASLDGIQGLVERSASAINVLVHGTPESAEGIEYLSFDKKLVIGRATQLADWPLPFPQVSPRHAEVIRQDEQFLIRDLASETGTYVNGKRIASTQPAVLQELDVFEIGPSSFKVEKGRIQVLTRGGHAHLLANQISLDVPGTDGKGTKRILHGITLEFQPATFCAIIGPSGSGKSSLLNVLAGRTPPTSGIVFLARENLYEEFERIKTKFTTVTQKDLFYENLTLFSSLMYTAELRLPTNYSSKERSKRVNEVIREVGMEKLAHARFSTFSGGQRKRASLANELLSNPSLLFVDEATSGLDEKSDREIMALFRSIADNGKTVVCVTHNLSHIVEYAQQLVVLEENGHVAFNGSPSQAKEYFSVEQIGEVFAHLQKSAPEFWAEKFAASSLGQQSKRSAVDATAKVSKLRIERDPVSPPLRLRNAFCHGWTVIKRLAELQLRDLSSLLVAVAQPIFVFLLIWIVFENIQGGLLPEGKFHEYWEGLGILYLLATSMLWFGCSNSAKELVKEKKLFQREHSSGLSSLGYLLAKSTFLIGMTLIQGMFLFSATVYVTGLQGSLLLYILPLIAISACGVGLGLAISAIAANTDVASAAVPLAIIPQVILAGRIKSLEGLAQQCAFVTAPSYWCYGSLCSVWNEEWKDSPKLYDEMYAQQHYWTSLAVVVLFAFLFFGVAYLSVSRSNKTA